MSGTGPNLPVGAPRSRAARWAAVLGVLAYANLAVLLAVDRGWANGLTWAFLAIAAIFAGTAIYTRLRPNPEWTGARPPSDRTLATRVGLTFVALGVLVVGILLY
jgi:hypothetical protein